MGAAGASRYLATERDLRALTPSDTALRARHQTAIDGIPLQERHVRCYHCSDVKGGLSIVATGLQLSEKENRQLGRTNLDAGVFVTKLSPMEFGFPLHGWLERQLNNNYGIAVEGTSSQPHNAWVVKRAQICVVVDVPEMLLRNSWEQDREYQREGRNVFYIPREIFVSLGQTAFPPKNIVYAFRTSLDEPIEENRHLRERFAGALAKGDLFEVRWLLALGAPITAAEHDALTNFLQVCRDKLQEPIEENGNLLRERFADALTKGDLFEVRCLLALGAPIAAAQHGALTSFLQVCQDKLQAPIEENRNLLRERFADALAKGDLFEVCCLLALGAPIAAAQHRALTSFLQVCQDKLQEPIEENRNLLRERFADALAKGDLFEVRWLLALGAPIAAAQHGALTSFLQVCQDKLQEPCGSDLLRERFADALAEQNLEELRWLLALGADVDTAQLGELSSLVWRRRSDEAARAIKEARPELDVEGAVQKLQPHLTGRDLERFQEALQEGLPGHEQPFSLEGPLQGDKVRAVTLLLEALWLSGTWKSLSLSNRSIGSEGTLVLAQALEGSTSLQCLNLRRNLIDDEGASALGSALAHNTSLRALDLWGNIIGFQGASALAQALERNSSLQTLGLCFNCLGHQGASALAEALQRNSSLQTLDLSGNNVGHQGASALAEALQRNSSLQTLDLWGNNVGHQGASALAEALQRNSSLQTLDLSFNGLGHQGASVLAEALQRNSSLQTLDLSRNDVGHQGASALAEALQRNSSLQTLDLSYNRVGHRVGHQGASALAKALERNTTLQDLNVARNHICNQGASALVQALEHNKTLQELNLSRNNIGDPGELFRDAIKCNGALQRLDLRRNRISDQGKVVLKKACKHIPALWL